MTQQVVHMKVSLPDGTTFEDTSSLGFTFEATGSNTGIAVGDLQNWVFALLNTAVGTQTSPLAAYLSSKISRASFGISAALTDVTAHLDGSPAGAPYNTFTLTLGAAGSSVDFPPQCAATVGYRADYSGDVEHGPTVSLPSTDQAIDQGAPATHTGVSRPRARDRARSFFGPLNETAFQADGSLGTTLKADLVLRFNDSLITQNPGLANQFNVVVWSRRNAAVKQVKYLYVDEFPTTVRRRGDTTANRVHSWVAVA
jgi:hypothetical protein